MSAWPDGFYFIGELRRAIGLFDGAMSKSPKEAWDEAVAEVERIRDVAESGKCWVCEESTRTDPRATEREHLEGLREVPY